MRFKYILFLYVYVFYINYSNNLYAISSNIDLEAKLLIDFELRDKFFEEKFKSLTEKEKNIIKRYFYQYKNSLNNDLELKKKFNLDEMEQTKPFEVGIKDISGGHAYELFISRYEDDLTQASFHTYGLRDMPKYLSSRGYFLIEPLNKTEQEFVMPFNKKAEGRLIDFDNILDLFYKYNKPPIKIFILGNQNYTPVEESLLYVQNDMLLMYKIAREILEVPEQNIYQHFNLSYEDFIKQFKIFIENLKKDELVIFYYSGLAENTAMPIFVDGQSIKTKDFYDLFYLFKNDTAILMDSGQKSNKAITEVIQEDSFERKRKNIFKFYSPLNSKSEKEINLTFSEIYQEIFTMGSYLLKNLKLGDLENFGLFSLFFLNVFVDFIIYFEDLNLSFSGFASLIDNKISILSEKGIKILPHLKEPLLQLKFDKKVNEFLLYKTVTETDEFIFTEAVKKETKQEEDLKLGPDVLSFKNSLKIDQEEETFYLTNISKEQEQVSHYYDKDKKFKQQSKFLSNYYSDYKDEQASLLRKAVRLNNLGNSFFKSGSYKEALAAYEQSLKIKLKLNNPQTLANGYNNIAILYLKSGKPTKAYEYLNNALQLYPKDNETRKEIHENIKIIDNLIKVKTSSKNLLQL